MHFVLSVLGVPGLACQDFRQSGDLSQERSTSCHKRYGADPLIFWKRAIAFCAAAAGIQGTICVLVPALSFCRNRPCGVCGTLLCLPYRPSLPASGSNRMLSPSCFSGMVGLMQTHLRQCLGRSQPLWLWSISHHLTSLGL